ncbi:sigma-54-dependent transcriptional regulator [Teredinibacter purpureus]|jgi:Response regulator containing CheY-like receiver, AAA-type ATPase, and DNA-binding domains|uniref:sigma-54-dependent transcriptional regulator n=1 Tax=Teredinibacter purpureus TaxID=2731756 RepID=UPI0005F7A834|nr:sigma-54 dependent transcriptional regulator [Teredinibacter purpureus]
MPDSVGPNAARILFVDDETSILKSLRRVTRPLNSECVFVESGAEALALLEASPFDVIVSDMRMPEMDGAVLLSQVAKRYPETMRLVLSGYSEDELIMSAINEGRIWGYIHKPWDDNLLLVTLQQALAAQQMMVERALLRHTVERFTREHKSGFCRFVGASAAMQTVYNQIERVAPSNASVFITGPSGTGKELAAEALHQLSSRQQGPLVPLNCAAIPSELMESEIFGHVKGAFSGAVANREGAAGQASGGTLFLDELGEMDISLQAKLLRFIQTGTYQKVGGSKLETADIRFVCATNRNPLQAIAEGLLREDLYYRLNVVSINMPLLAERDNDASQLANYFLQLFAKREEKELVGFTQDAEKVIDTYGWPGNVRQLENCVHSVVVMCSGPLITVEDLKTALHLTDTDIAAFQSRPVLSSSLELESPLEPAVLVGSGAALPSSSEQLKPLSVVERDYIEKAIERCQGNVVKAATCLEVSPSTLYRKMQNWEAKV